MDITTKCTRCEVEFDVDALKYDEEEGYFGCPECGSTDFQLLLKDDQT
jgi:DNA-directed RNA polymerase subunit RPC12/RpoP